ncbi:TolB family protein [Aquimarina sp. AU474]|uniref:TolB family protein n=1 Tax=Aquimarina sp. AU474 TaxID=2108529 RepID=UPI000D69D37E|nr:PD40 domain-containing protein [Aquimarina sp. AU474]
MFLKKSFLGLFFFSVWGTVISQGEQLEITDQEYVQYTDAETDEIFIENATYGSLYSDLYRKNNNTYKSGVSKEYSDVSGKEEVEYALLLNLLTIRKNKSKNFSLHVLNINSGFSDYAPSFYEKELVFASSRDVNSISKAYDANSNQPFLDLYTTNNKSDKETIKKLKGGINTKFHESSAAFTKDRKTVYFTRNNYYKRKSKRSEEGAILLKIYRAQYIDGKWDNVEELPFSSDEYSIAHPTLSPDGRLLYFASDMPGTLGKSDLYVVEINRDGSFGKPVNMGDQINTEGRETFPYVSDQGNLFFASDGHLGYGDLDIFMVLPDVDNNVGVYNLGAPINSPKDDFTFIINEENKVGYFASNRRGSVGGDDIYGFEQLVSFPNHYDHKIKTIKKIERVLDLKPNEEEITSW